MPNTEGKAKNQSINRRKRVWLRESTDTTWVSIYCKEIDKIHYPPITTHLKFPTACLSRTMLTIAWHGYRNHYIRNHIASLPIFVVVSQTGRFRYACAAGSARL